MAGSANIVFQRVSQVVKFLTEAKEFDRVLGKVCFYFNSLIIDLS